MTTTDLDHQNWISLGPKDAYPVGYQGVESIDGRTLAIFRLSPDEIYVVDNQCPHEGYPLAKGSVQGYNLTCCWHNFKFDLRNGTCLKGEEDVRSYPVRLRGETIEINLSGDDPKKLEANYMKALEDGFHHRRIGQIARSVIRFLNLGMSPPDLIKLAVNYDAQHNEYGVSHAFPLATDVLTIIRSQPESTPLALMQVFEHVADTCVRFPPRPTPAPIMPTQDPHTTGETIRQLIEEENLAEAEARLRGALEAGWSKDVVEPWFFNICADHFFGFGHGLIFTSKAFELLDQLGWDAAPEILPAVLFRIGNDQRDDVLPEWAWFRNKLAETIPHLPRWYAQQDNSNPLLNPKQFIDRMTDGKREDALQAISDELDKGTAFEAIIDGLSSAASTRIARFNVAIDTDPSIQEGWLDVTHTLTYVNALRFAWKRRPSADLLRVAYYAARFVHGAKGLDGPQPVLAKLDPQSTITPQALLKALEDGKPEQAMALAQTLSREPNAYPIILTSIIPHLFSDRIVRPIFYAHIVKTAIAALSEAQESRLHFDEHSIENPAVAVMKFLASPLRERSTSRLTHEAQRFLNEGRVPKTLT